MGGRTAESSRAHGGQTGWGDFQSNGGGRPEGPGWNVDMNEFGQVWGGEVMDGLVCVEEDLVINPVFYGKPVELVENRGDVAADGGSGDNSCCCILDQLDFMEEFMGETKEQ